MKFEKITYAGLDKHIEVHIAEEQGNVWSLEGFESAFNSEEISHDIFIRFVDPVKEEL